MVKKIAILLIALMLLIPICVLAENTSDATDRISEKYDRQGEQGNKVVDSSSQDVQGKIEENKKTLDLEGNSGTSKPEEALESFSKGTYRFTWQILVEVQRNSFPVCLLGIIAGALIFSVFGPRNMTRRRYGALLMFGFLTIWVIAQVAPVIFMVMIE